MSLITKWFFGVSLIVSVQALVVHAADKNEPSKSIDLVVEKPLEKALEKAPTNASTSAPTNAPAKAPAKAEVKTEPSMEAPYTVEYFRLTAAQGPMSGVLVKVNLTDPKVKLKVALADDRDPDGDGPCVGQLDTPSNAARKHDFAVTLNASFFATPKAKEILGKKISYYVGNCGHPVGWHFSSGKQLTKPVSAKLRATMIVHDTGKVSFADDVTELPKDTRYAVSGNALLLKDGENVVMEKSNTRHPRSAVGTSASGKTLYLVALDGRQCSATKAANGSEIPAHSCGASLNELADVILNFGAANAINLDGGGSTAMIVKDPLTSAFSVANRPSDASALKLPILVERPVIDVIGISVAE